MAADVLPLRCRSRASSDAGRRATRRVDWLSMRGARQRGCDENDTEMQRRFASLHVECVIAPCLPDAAFAFAGGAGLPSASLFVSALKAGSKESMNMRISKG
ncbi:hypothetical protein [Burkholderia sp. 22313]|uniref:hypothetical protein n=1 Tax=Burkholderia sp. 22313 TaxID=3453908 RepID=UPI002B5E7953|nr:hypothetical protein [Burkholderia sp.]